MHSIQQRILQLTSEHGLTFSSLRGLGRLIGVDSAQKVKHHIEQLERKGLLAYDREHKTLKLSKGKGTIGTNLVLVPILGAANAGPATLFADGYLEGYLKISSKLIPRRKLFAIQVEGNSMNRANVNGKNIGNGDYIIIDPQVKNPKNGDYVLSVIDDVANIKRYYWDKENNQIVLTSESTQNFPPIIIDPQEVSNYLVNGKVIQVIKKPEA